MVPFYIDIGRLPDSLDDLDQPWHGSPTSQPAPSNATRTELAVPKRATKKARKSASPVAPDETEDEGLSSVPATPANKLPARGTIPTRQAAISADPVDVPAALFTPPAARSKSGGKRKADDDANIYAKALQDYQSSKRARHVEIPTVEVVEPDSDTISHGVPTVMRHLYKRFTGMPYIDTNSLPPVEPAQLDGMLEMLDGYEVNGTVIPAVTQEIRHRLLQAQNVYPNNTNVLKLLDRDLQTMNDHQSVQGFSATQQDESADAMEQAPVTFTAKGALDNSITATAGKGKQRASICRLQQQSSSSHPKRKHIEESERVVSEEDPIVSHVSKKRRSLTRPNSISS